MTLAIFSKVSIFNCLFWRFRPGTRCRFTAEVFWEVSMNFYTSQNLPSLIRIYSAPCVCRMTFSLFYFIWFYFQSLSPPPPKKKKKTTLQGPDVFFLPSTTPVDQAPPLVVQTHLCSAFVPQFLQQQLWLLISFADLRSVTTSKKWVSRQSYARLF